jgi:hypothetical protein
MSRKKLLSESLIKKKHGTDGYFLQRISKKKLGKNTVHLVMRENFISTEVLSEWLAAEI